MGPVATDLPGVGWATLSAVCGTALPHLSYDQDSHAFSKQPPTPGPAPRPQCQDPPSLAQGALTLSRPA